MTDAAAPEWTVRSLNDRLERDDPFFILDVRNQEEFENARIEGRTPIATKNVPYFEMLETADNDDLVTAVERYAQERLVTELPINMPLLTVCAKGGTSGLVAQALHRLGYAVSNLGGGIAAWSDFYDARPAVTVDGVTVTQVARPARGCLSYVVESERRAAIVDPGRHIDFYLSLATDHGMTIAMVVDTHAHADHVSGGAALAARLGVPYYLHPYDAIHPIDLVPARVAYEPLRDRLQWTVGRVRIESIWTPGHTLGNMTLLVDGKYLLAGDSIFVRSIARPDLGGRAETWTSLHFESMQRLLTLPDDTMILPGHFSRRDEADGHGVFGATLGALRQSNEGLLHVRRGAGDFSDYILSSLPQFPKEYVDIKRINAGLLQATDSEVAELETGKNRCAMSST
jgi:glyoxylase-like metal-dependent hydrolase (beta-lactamase superfamily II)/rhodanese-related sulfurtransferase